jgi:beta-xylosidase
MRLCYRSVTLLLIGFVLMSMNVFAQDETMQNPIFEANLPDPFILEVDDTYYAYSTNSNSRNVPVYRSTDLVSWEFVRDVMPALPRWVYISRPDVWAPEVIQVDDQYLLFYTARDKASRKQCIGLATSESPEGPFRDQNDEAFICQSREGGSIDASPFRDEDGTLYLYWKNDGNCCMMATYLYVQELSANGTELVGEPVQLVRNDAPWEGGVVEAPTMWRHDDQYYLFYSGNVYAGEAYAVGYALCESAVGPCEDAEENPILKSSMDTQPLVVGPGHQSIIMDDAGETWLIYHVWQVTDGGTLTSTRQMWMDRLVWTEDGPVVEGPTREAQPVPVIEAEE